MNKRTLLLLSTAITTCVALCCQVCNAEPWKVTLHLDGNKPEYLIGEPIYFTKIIENAGTTEDTFWYDEKGSFIVYDQNGDSIFTPIGASFYADAQPVAHAAPRVSYLDLIDFYICSNRDKGLKFLEPGDDKVQARIRIKDKNIYHKKLAYLYSEVISIKIIDPKGTEKDAYDKYRKYLEFLGKSRRYDCCEEIIKKYPNSVYAPESYIRWIWGQAQKNKPVWKADELIKYIEKYPDHPRASNRVSSVIIALGIAKRPDLVSEKLIKLKSRIKNRQVIEEIDRELHKYETGYYKANF